MIPLVSIREANANDADDLLRVINDAFIVEQFFAQGPRLSAAELDDYWTRGTFFVAESGEQFAGCVFVDASPPTGYFGLLSVERTLQRQGLGGRLVAAAEDCCRAAGCTAIKIRVVNLRSELPPFYRSRDYEETGVEAFESSNTSVPCHFIAMSKRL